MGGISRRIAAFQQYLIVMRRRESEGALPVFRQTAELVYLRLRNGIPPYYYFGGALYRRDIPWREKLEHVYGDHYLKLIRRLNPEEYNFVAMNKIVSYGVLRSFGIATPQIYGFINAANGQTFDGRPLATSGDLDALIKRTGVDELCFKLVGGWSGRGFIKVSFDRTTSPVTVIRGPLRTRGSLDEFWTADLSGARGPSYICQGAIVQHPALAEFHKESVNTARVMMFQGDRGRWEMFGAYLRMGVGGSSVDNINAGGIASTIDVESGRLSAAILPALNRMEYTHHPTSGVPIKDFVLPLWNDVKLVCEKSGHAFPYYRILGLDVAFGPEAPLIIEVECEPSAFQHSFMGVGAKRLITPLLDRGSLGWR
jgi:hypothetical protein